MQKSVLILVFIFLNLCVFGQTNKIIDSLKIKLDKTQSDSIKLQTLGDLSYYYLFESTDTALIYGRKQVRFATKNGYNKFNAQANRNVGNAFLYANKYDSATVYFNKSYKIFEKFNFNKSGIYTSLGMLYKKKGNYEKALQFYFDGITYDESKGNDYGKFIKLMNIANVYQKIGKTEKSLKYQLVGLKMTKSTTNKDIKYAKGTLLNNISGNYIQTNEYDKALFYLKESLKFNQKNENKKEVARNYNNIGALYEKKNELTDALKYLNKALELRNSIGDEDELIETHMELGTTYGKLKQEIKSNYHYNFAVENAKKSKNIALISETYLAISNNYTLQKKIKKELENYKLHIKYRDSVLKLNETKSINEIEVKYQTAKKNKEIAEQNLKLQQQKTQYNYMTGIAIFLLIGAILTWFLFQQRQKRKNQEIVTLKREHQIKTLETLIEGEEKERFRIAKELHDGVNGDLSAIKFKLSSLLEMNNNVIKEAITMIDNSCNQVRAISHNLVPPSLENFNLAEATETFCHNMDETHPIKIDFQYIGESLNVSKKAQINMYRIVQELINNAIKHAEASEINVQMSYRKKLLQITVEDNGKGFDKNNIKDNGIGLNNIKSRAEFLHANLDIVSDAKGTSTTIEIDTTKLDDN